MQNTEDRKWLYEQLKDNGYEIGSQEEFESSLDNNEEDAKWYHEQATSLGLEVGNYEDFGSLFRNKPKENPVVEGVPAVPMAENVSVAPTPSKKPKESPFGINANIPTVAETARGMVNGVNVNPFASLPNQPIKPITEFGEGVKEGGKQLVAGAEFAAGETLRPFVGTSEDDKAALERIESLEKEGKDVAKNVQSTATISPAMALGLKVFGPKGSSAFVRTMEKTAEANIAAQKALNEADGNVEQAKSILEEKANKQTLADTMRKDAERKMAEARPTKSWGWIGSMIPQMVGTGVGLGMTAVTKNPMWAQTIGLGNMAGLTASAAGSAMAEARQAGASNAEVWTAGLLNGVIENVSERFALGKYTKRLVGSAKNTASQMVKKAVSEVDSPARKELADLLQKANKQLDGKLLSGKNVKDYLADIMDESLSEGVAEGLQTITPMLYQNPDKYPSLFEIVYEVSNNALEGIKGGLFMGSVLGGLSKSAEHRMNRARRKAQGFVDVAEIINPDGTRTVVEVVKDEEGQDAFIEEGEFIPLNSQEVGRREQFKFDDFERGQFQNEQDESYDIGATLETSQELKDAKNMFEKTADEVRERNGLGEDGDVDAFLGENPLEKAAEIYDEDEEVGRGLLDYINAKATLDGIIDKTKGQIKTEVEQAEAMIDSRKSLSDGMIHPAVMKTNDRQVYVINGNVERYDDGNVDTQKSSDSIIVMDATTGKKEFASPKDLLSIDVVIDPEVEKKAVRTTIGERIATDVENKLNGVLAFNPNDTYEVLNPQGERTTIQVVSDNGDGTINVIMGDVAEPKKVTKNEVQTMADNLNSQRADEMLQGRNEMLQSEKLQKEAEQMAVPTATETPAEVAPAPRVVPTTKDGKPDFNAMDAEMFVEEYASRYGEENTAKIARKNIAVEREKIAKLDKKIDDVTDPNQIDALYEQRQASEAVVNRYNEILERIGLSEDANETEADQKSRLRNEANNRIASLFPDGMPNVESFILADIATGNRLRWSDKETNGVVTSRGLGAELGLSETERIRRLPLIGKDAMTPEEYAESLRERLDAVGIRYDESSLRDAVLDVYSSVDSRKGAWDALENISKKMQEPQADMDWEDMQQQLAYNKAQENVDNTPELPSLDTIDEETPISEGEYAEMEQQARAEEQADYDAMMEENQPIEETEPVEEVAEPTNEETASLAEEITPTVLSEEDYVNAELVKLKPEEMSMEDWEYSDEYVDAYNKVVDTYPDYIKSLADSGALQEAFDKGTLGEQIAIRKNIQTAGFEVTDLIDTGKGKKSKAKKTRGQELMENLGLTEKEDARRKPLRERASMWEDKVGVKVNLIEDFEDIPTDATKRAIDEGQRVTGWVVNGEVFLYMPYIANRTEVDKTYLHEVVAHIGMKNLLGKEGYKAFCERVFNEVMTDAEREFYRNYPNVENEAQAADEFIAHLAEDVNMDATVWQKIVEIFRDALLKMGIDTRITNADIEAMLRDSYKKLVEKNGMAGINEKDETRLRVKPYGADNPYYNKKKATKKERDEIISTIIRNKYDYVGTDIIRVDNSLFLVDHTDADDLYKTYLNDGKIPDGQGYGIRKKYNFAKINNDNLYEIISNISESYKLDEASIRNRLQDIGIEPRNLLELDFASAIRAGIGDNVMGNGESGGRRNYIESNASGFDSGNDKGESESVESNNTPTQFRITPEEDARYLQLVEEGNIEEAQKMVNAVANASGYNNDESWKKAHTAPRKSEDNVNPFNTEELVPADYWTHPEWYTQIRHYRTDRESYYNMVSAINKYKQLIAEGKQDEADKVTVTMYRGVDKTANTKESTFRNGDWITPSRSYAKDSAPYGRGRVIEQEVPLKNIWWDGNSINEWGYDDGADYVYKDTKNNRKLIDAVTYDDNGNVIPLSKRFNSRNADIRFRTAESAPVFYSNAEYAVKAVKQDKATPEQWLKMIEKNGGLKAGEDKWLGLSDWLKSSDKKTLTKQEVLDFIKENQIQIEEVEYAENPQGFEELKKEYDGWLRDGGYDYAWDKLIERYGYDSTVAFDDVGGELVVQYGNTASKLLGGEVSTINNTRLKYTTEGLDNKREIALTVPTIESWNESDEIHFGDAGNGRAIAWVRFGETTDADGNRVLVIDEVQSKRHQEGREKGYRPSNIEQYLKDNGVEVIETGEFYEFHKNGELDKRFSKGLLHNDINRAKQMYVGGYVKSDIPSAPFEKNWAELAMKRILRYAAENGFDKVAWTTGEQQADRYSLAKVYNSIEREDNPSMDGRRFVLNGANYDTVVANGDGIIVESSINEAEGKSLSDLVGKDLAVKMMSLEDGDNLDSEEIRIGGEGMKAFYDQMIPSFMNKYGKKWGVKVGEVTMPSLEENNTMHSIDVTDAMRESVMQGQPLFRTAKTNYESQFAELQSEYDALDKNDAEALNEWRDKKADVVRSYISRLSNKFGLKCELYVFNGGREEEMRKAYDTMIEKYKAKGIEKVPSYESFKKNVSNPKVVAIHRKSINFVTFNISADDAELNIGQFAETLFHENAHRITEKMYSKQEFEQIWENAKKSKNSIAKSVEKLYSDKSDAQKGNEFIAKAIGELVSNHNRLFTNYLMGKDNISAEDLVKKLKYSLPLGKLALTETLNEFKNEYQERVLQGSGSSLLGGGRDGGDIEVSERDGGRNRKRDWQGDQKGQRAERRLDVVGAATNLAESLGVKLNVIEDVNEITDSNTRRQRAKRGAKAWYDINTDQVYFVAPNATSIEDAQMSVLHEVVAHKGLRDVVGRENFNKFLDKVFYYAEKEIRSRIVRLASQNGWNFRVATEEYLASLAEEGFDSRENRTFLQKVRDFFMDMLREAKIAIGFNISDNDMRYMLWRTYQMQKSQGAMSVAEDVVMQQKVGVGNFRTRPAGESMTEEEQIIADAKADGTYLKAPNGKDTNLTPKQWAQVRTKAFKEWFGDWENDSANASKVVDVNGEPMVVWHQTNATEYVNVETGEKWDDLDWRAKMEWDERDDWDEYWKEQDFYTFSRVNARATNEFDGFFFAPEYDEYHEYGERAIPAFLNIRKPASREDYNIDSSRNYAGRDERLRLQSEGYDGVIREYDGVVDEYIAFEPNQIKSATENVGTFDSNNDDVRFRATPTPTTDKARKLYDEAVRKHIKDRNNVGRFENLWHHFRESYQDSMLAVKALYDAVLKETGNKLHDFEDLYKAENRLSSTNKAHIEAWERDYMKPLQKAILSLIKKGTDYNAIIDYLLAKSGLERNEVLAKRDAEQMAKGWEKKRLDGAKRAYNFEQRKVNGSYGGQVATLNKNLGTGAITQEYYDAQIAKLAKQRDNDLATLERKYNRLVLKIQNDMPEMYEKAWSKLRDKDYSGLTELTGENDAFSNAAQKMVAAFESTHDTTELWKTINAATKATLRKSYDSGMMNKETFEKTAKMFKYYIPLRGWDNNAASDHYEYMANSNMKILPALKTAKGRTSRADDPIATIGSMGESSIIQGNRNLMKLKLLNFAERNHTSLLTVSEQWYVQKADGTWVEDNPVIPENATGDEVDAIVKKHEADMLALGDKASKKRNKLNLGLHATTWEGQEHVVRVKRNGKEYQIFVNGNPIAAQAINGFTNPNAKEGWMKRAAQTIKNFMARAYTSLNPAFVITNLSLDLLWAGTTIAIKEDAKYVAQYTKNVASLAWQLPRLISKWQKGTLDMNKPIERYFKEFIENGGETGFTQLNTVDDYKRNMARFIKEAQSGAARMPKKAWRAVWDGVEFLNRSAEDTTRFMTYMTSRQMGRNITDSIYDAKEVTVNFNKKGRGEYGATFLNFAYIFFNATIQSLTQFGRLLKHHPKKTTAALTTFASAGLLVPMLSMFVQAMLSDDDDEPTYWDLPEWVRRNNIVLYAPFTKSGYLTVPLPHELRPFYGMGELAFSVLNGKESVEGALAKAVEGFGGLLPFDFTGNGGNMMVNFTPTIAQPIAQLIINQDYFGTPIYRKTAFNELDPEWTKAYKSTNTYLVDATEFLNELTGGDAVEKGWLDINPAKVEHLFESYLGGMGKTLNRTAKTLSMLWDEDMREWRNVPILSNFYQVADERTSGSQINRAYFDAVDEAEDIEHLISGYKKQARMGALEYAEKLTNLINSDIFKRYATVKGKQQAISNLNKALRESNNPMNEEQIETQIMNLKIDMLEELEKLEKSESSNK